jgi:hypothetical protein
MLLNAIETRRRRAIAAKRDQAEKIRRQTRPRPRGVQERILRSKAQRSEKKQFRRRIDHE